MPIYEYRCTSCGQVFEVMQKFSDDPITECRYCEDGVVEKLISRSSFILKGTGWYKTDYAQKGNGECKPREASSGSECSTCPAAGKS